MLPKGIFAICLLWSVDFAAGTSSKMDFLPLGHVRTDPILSPTCLSDHVHTFYGANASLRPETKWKDMRTARGNSGNVKENKSLYWHPSIYKFDPITGVYTLVQTWFATAYYIWETGKAKAFPDGFQMIANMSSPRSRWRFDCNGPSACTRKNCSTPAPWTSSERAVSFKEKSSTSWNFPEMACAELEMRLAFPSCLNPQNASAPDHRSHVSYDVEPDSDGSFDGQCPESHGRKIPEIQLYIRIQDYEGGHHVFSDGTDMLHADYFSGWNETEFQKVLDTCNNSGAAAMPDKWCEDHLTFRDAPKTYDESRNNDPDIVKKLKRLQPISLDLRSTITPEEITNITILPRGTCTGTLIEAATTTMTTTTTAPSSDPCKSCFKGCLFAGTCYTVHPETQMPVTQQICSQFQGTQWCGLPNKTLSLLSSHAKERVQKQRQAELPLKILSVKPEERHASEDATLFEQKANRFLKTIAHQATRKRVLSDAERPNVAEHFAETATQAAQKEERLVDTSPVMFMQTGVKVEEPETDSEIAVANEQRLTREEL